MICDYTFDPEERWDAFGAFLWEDKKVSQKSKLTSTAMLPTKDMWEAQTGPTEISYDPMTRYHTFCQFTKPIRGAKSTEHMEILRVSDPTYGSLMPAKERVAAHELPYDPARRFVALAKLLDMPRGAKSLEHLQNLRINDPKYSRFVTSCAQHQDLEEHEDLAAQTGSDESFGSGEDSVSQKRPSVSRLPRILSNQILHCSDDEEEEWQPTLTNRRAQAWVPPSPKRNAFYFPNNRLPPSYHLDGGDDVFPDDASMRSAARTSMNDRYSERSSSDTIASFLDDHDVHASGDFAGLMEGFSPRGPISAGRHLGKASWSENSKSQADDAKKKLGAQAPANPAGRRTIQ